MNDLMIKGTRKFSGIEIPVVLGGFGEDKKCLSDKTIAEIHGMREPDVRRRITDNIKRFKDGVDFIDLKSRASDAQQLLSDIGYTQMQISKAEHIYILSEKGYARLIKIMDTDLAWEIHDKLMDEYFEMREERVKGIDIQEALLNPDTIIQLATNLKAQMAENDTLKNTVKEKELKIADMQPKVNFANAVATSHTSILVGDLAKLLKQNGVEIGANRLFEWLRENGYLIKRRGADWNMPTQKSMDLGLFEIKESTVNNPDGSVRINKTPKVTGYGQQYFINIFLVKENGTNGDQ